MSTGGLCPVGGVIRALLCCGAGKGRVMSHVACRGEDTHNELYVSIGFAGLLPSFFPPKVMLVCVRGTKNNVRFTA